MGQSYVKMLGNRQDFKVCFCCSALGVPLALEPSCLPSLGDAFEFMLSLGAKKPDMETGSVWDQGQGSVCDVG